MKQDTHNFMDRQSPAKSHTQTPSKPMKTSGKPYQPSNQKIPFGSSFTQNESDKKARACKFIEEEKSSEIEDNGRERLKRHRVEVAGNVWIPEIWGQEDFLKDWIDCAAFDAALVPSKIMMARAALAQEGRRAANAAAGGLRILENRC